ncbi:glycosyl transferase family 2 [Propionicimonas paludicola]|uniref:Glycosyl transferase family 2 n=1 Tax=Propionicimonas paludicola TaxID=185243 RepID=A0A2A9CSW0_9ACTN|nr:glycosyltransferase [Propionicimonas paludicola]PFG17458.1 glycosyl transferase family 2 [Propionicimonas paludicola]
MPGAQPRVGAIVVTHQSAPSIADCLTSILADEAVAAVVVIDNAGDEATRTVVTEVGLRDSRVCHFDPHKNLGLAGGCNLGAALLPDVDFICLVNPRLKLRRGLSELCADAPATSAVWAGAVISDQRQGMANVRQTATVHRELSRILHGERSYAAQVRGGSDGPVKVERLSGDLLCLRRTTFEALGGFDESLELHFEDDDLCRRAQRQGGVWLLPVEAGRLIPRPGGSTPSVQDRQARAVSRVRYLRKVRGDCPATSAVARLLAMLDAVARAVTPGVGWKASRQVLGVELAEIRLPESQWVLRWPGGRPPAGR